GLDEPRHLRRSTAVRCAALDRRLPSADRRHHRPTGHHRPSDSNRRWIKVGGNVSRSKTETHTQDLPRYRARHAHWCIEAEAAEEARELAFCRRRLSVRHWRHVKYRSRARRGLAGARPEPHATKNFLQSEADRIEREMARYMTSLRWLRPP